jgi:hypothetical protein
VLGGLHVRGAVERRLLAAVVEVEVGQDHAGDVADLGADGRERRPQLGDAGAVPLVDPGVAGADAGVDEDRPVGMAHEPGVHRERLERGVLRMPLRHRFHHRERQPFHPG